MECDKNLSQISDNMEVERMDREIKQGIISAATRSIPKSTGRKKNKLVPWWDEKCKQAVKSRNKAFKLVKRYHNFQHLIQYKQAQAIVRKPIRQAKRLYWRKFCGSIGSTTKIGEVWGMLKKMGGDRKDWNYPVLSNGNEMAVTNKEKAELMVKTFVAVHSSNNLTEEGRQGREKTRDENREILKRKDSRESEVDVPFTIGEMKRAIAKTRTSAPGKDTICYRMIKQCHCAQFESICFVVCSTVILALDVAFNIC